MKIIMRRTLLFTPIAENIEQCCMLLLLLLIFNNGISQDNKHQDPVLNQIPRIVFVNPSNTNNVSTREMNDLKSFKHSLKVAGFSMDDLNSEELASANLMAYHVMVIPYATAKQLKEPVIKRILKAVDKGSNLIFDGDCELRKALHIQLLNDSLIITRIRDLSHSDRKLYWTTPCHTKPIDNRAGKNAVLCIDDTSKLPIAVNGDYGKGRFIYFSALFDPNTDKGYSRFPFLIETMGDVFHYKPIAARQAAEMYFDQGNRTDTLSAYELAKFWRKNKVKRIYASGWYFDSGYDYDALIKACHQNGILVLCWLETPMISINFWNKHPEWREKTPFQRDAQIDWRYLMNLADENCRKEVFKEFDDFLMKYDWDGVDFAELYFEPSPVGPELPENFTPMNSTVRKEFEQIGGFDPVLLFDTKSPHHWKTNHDDWKKFATYRKELLYRLKKSFLDFFMSVKTRKKDFEVMLTALDVSITPELSDYIGEDTGNTLNLFKQYDITLQIEDPSNCWGLTPDRYDKMGQLYRKYVTGKDRLAFDCNVVSAHEMGYGGFPSEIPTGEEIRQIAYNMNLHDVRPAFYSEDVVSEKDYRNISTVLANKTNILVKSKNEWAINSPFSVLINCGNADISFQIDHQEWRAADEGNIIIPEGKHTVTFSSNKIDTSRLWIKNLSGNLREAVFKEDYVEFNYSESITSCYVILNRQPGNIFIDGKSAQCQVFKNEDDEYVLKLPEGTHKVKIGD